MALTSPSTTSSAGTAVKPRLAGPDVVRAVALIGVVAMNYHGYLIIRGASRGNSTVTRFFDPFDGPLATRFAATFVLVAGVGVTLLTRRSMTSPSRVTEMRWRLVRRGTLLYVGGLLLDTIWDGTIIPYYGAMFVIAAALFTLRSRWIVLVGTVAVTAGAGIRIWRFRQDEAGVGTEWLFDPDGRSIRTLVFDTFVNGTHPLLPWLGFFCVGILLGRVLDTRWWRPVAIVVGAVLFVGAELVSTLTSTDFEMLVLSTDPGSRGVGYVASALGTALLAYACIDLFASRFPLLTDPLRRAGQMTLTLYLLHIVVFNFTVDWMGWIEPDDLFVALRFAFGFWVVAIIAGTIWHRRHGRGPAERIYRAIGG